jgi:hypothetical protein
MAHVAVSLWRRVSVGVVATLVGTMLLSAAAVLPHADASSHREAPLISQDPTADNTDTYAFVSPDKPDTVTLVANYYPYEGPAGGPNFYRFSDDVLYQIHIDNVGDAKDHIVYQFRFTTYALNGGTFLYNTGPIKSLDDPNWNLRQSYKLTRVDDKGITDLGANLPTPPDNVGKASLPDYDAVANQAIKTLPNGVSVFAGQRADPFYADVGAIFDLAQIRKLPGNAGGGVNTFAGFNVKTIALQVPIAQLTKDGSKPTSPTDPAAVIGVWATASRQTTTVLRPGGGSTDGPWVQISRLGSPLVNEAVIPIGQKDIFNGTAPANDGQFLPYVLDPELAKLFKLLFNVDSPPAPRNDLVMVFLTGVPGLTQPPNVTPSEELRLNVAVPPSASPNRMGVVGGDNAGFPNGRRLGDDVIDIAFQAVAGILVDPKKSPNNQLGDGVDGPDKPYGASFPYAASPYSGSAYKPYGA